VIPALSILSPGLACGVFNPLSPTLGGIMDSLGTPSDSGPPQADCILTTLDLVNPLPPTLGGEKETQRGSAPLHAPMGGTGEAELARDV